MFNSILTIRNSFDIQPDPHSVEDTDPRFTAPCLGSKIKWTRPT